MAADAVKLSIIIPIYNAEKYLERCLASVSAQSYANFECIMVDDGSSDDSAEICKRFASSDARFKYDHQENAGVSAARNRGIALATGEAVGFCDADDFIEPDMYECLMHARARTHAEIVGCALTLDKGSSAVVQRSGEETILEAAEALRHLCVGNRYGGVEVYCRVYDRDLLREVPFRDDIKIGEDLEFMVRAICRCKHILYLDTVKYHYCVHGGSAYQSEFHEGFWTLQEACRSVVREIDRHYPELNSLAQRCLIEGNFTIIRKLCRASLLDKNSYKRIKREITPCMNRRSLKGSSCKRKFAIRLFLMSRKAFILAYKGR